MRRTFDRYGVDISPFPAFCERYANGMPLRPPMAQRPARASIATMPAPRVPEPAPAVVSLDVSDEAAVARQIRTWFSAGRTPRAIAANLNRLGAPGNRGSQWYASTVKVILLHDPCPRSA